MTEYEDLIPIADWDRFKAEWQLATPEERLVLLEEARKGKR